MIAHAASPAPIPETGARSGITFLRDAIAAYFAENNIPAVVAAVGLKYRSFIVNQAPGTGAARVVVIPGKFDGGASLRPREYGVLDRRTRNASQVCNPRELLHFSRLVTLSIWAPPISGRADDEGASIGVVEDMLEQVARAVTYAHDDRGGSLAASIEWGPVAIVAPPSDKSFGAELLVQLTQKCPLYDRTLEIVQGTPGALQKQFA